LSLLGIIYAENEKQRLLEALPDIIDGANAKGRELTNLKAVLSSPVRHRVLCGGNSSGKSTDVTADALWTAQGNHPYRETPRPPVYLRHFTETEDTIDTILMPRYRELHLPETLRGGCFEKAYERGAQMLYFANGSVIRFCTYTQAVRVQQGERVHVNYFDESPPQDKFQEAQARKGPRHKSESLTGLTPWDPDKIGRYNVRPWIIDHLVAFAKNNSECLPALQRKDVEVFYLTSYDNPDYKDSDVDEMAAGCATEAERQARVYGKVSVLMGIRFPGFDSKFHLVEGRSLPQNATYYGAIDWHQGRPTAGMFAYVVPEGDVYFYTLFYEEGIGPQIQSVAHAIGRARRGHDLYWIRGDCSGLQLPTADTGRTGLQIFQDEGVLIDKAPHGEIARQNRYAIFDDYLYNSLTKGQQKGKPGVYFHDVPEMERLVWEMQRCRMKERTTRNEDAPPSDKVLDKDMDCIDCASMLLQGGPVYISQEWAANYSYWSPPKALSNIEVTLVG